MREYENKTKDQLIDELAVLRQRISELEKLENQIKLVQEALRGSEKRFRELAELLPEMIFELATREYYIRQIVFETDTEGNITFANQILFDTLGYTREDFDKGLNILQMIPPEDREWIMENFQRRLNGKDLGITEYMAQRKDGSRFPVIAHTSIVTDEVGNPVGLRGIALNITERKLMETALQESEKRFRDLAELLPQTIFETDEKGILTFASTHGFASYGYTKEDFDKGLSILQMLVPEDHDRAKENIQRILSGEESGGNEYTAMRKDGSPFPVLIYSRPIIHEKKPVGLRGIVIDITERKRAETRFVKLNETFLNFGPDFEENINILTEACGELLGGICALYNRLKKGLLCSIGQWQTPEDYNPIDNPDGHICYDVIKKGQEAGIYIARNLLESPYFQSDPNVALFGLKTYVGYPVSCFGQTVGSLCVVYQEDVEFDENDKNILEILAAAIGIEEERKRKEEALQESEERYRSLTNDVLNTSTFGIFILDSDFRIVWINQTLERYFGLRKDEVTGKDKRQLIRERIKYIFEDPERFTEKVLATYNNNTYIENFECHVLPDGEREERWLEHWSQPIRSGLYTGGRIEHYSDITERKRAEEALRESEKRFRELTELLPEIVFEIDTKGNFTLINQTGFDALGYIQEDLDKGLNAFQVIVPEDREKARKNLQRRQRGEDIGIVEYTMQRKNGSRFPVIVHASIVTDEEGKPAGLRGVAVNITERKQAEEKLKQRTEELERSKAELQQSLQELLKRVERQREFLVTRPIPAIYIEEKGATFLYPADRAEEAYALFLSRKDANRPTLVITRTFPPRFQRKLGRDVETVWLTSNRVPRMVCVDPSDTMNLLLVLTEFFKRAPEGVVLFEGVEYIISIAGFERFLHIVQLLNDKIATLDGTIYMILELEVLDEKEAKHILRECLHPPTSVGVEEEAKDLMNENI